MSDALWHGDGVPTRTRRELDRASVLLGWATYLDGRRDQRAPASVVLALAETAADVVQAAVYEWHEAQEETTPAGGTVDAVPTLRVEEASREDVVASLRRAREAGRGDEGPQA